MTRAVHGIHRAWFLPDSQVWARLHPAAPSPRQSEVPWSSVVAASLAVIALASVVATGR